MSLSIVSITLNIRNNRNYAQRIDVLGSPINPLDTANALTEYRWDITSFVSSASDSLILDYMPVGASVFSTFTAELNNPNTETIVNALNTLGIGYFNAYTELGQLYISTNNDNYVFGNLTINSNIPTTSTTSTTTTAAPTTSTTSTTTTAAPTTSTTSTTTTAAPTTSTTSTTTTEAPTTTSTTSTTTTEAPTTTTTSTTTTTTTLFTNLVIDMTSGVGGYTIGALDVNSVTPTLTGGTDVPYSTDTHAYNTSQVGINETLNIFVSAFSLNGCITVTDSASNIFQQNVTGTGTYSFTGLTIDNITPVIAVCSDGACTPPPPTTSTTSTTTTAAPTTTSTTSTTTTEAPTTSTTSTTTTAAFETFLLAYSTIDGATACSDYPTLNTTNYYATSGSTLTTGTIIYTDTALTNPAPNGFYSNGINYWNTSAGAGNLQNQTSCNPTTSTTSTTTTEAPTTTSTTSTTTTLPVFGVCLGYDASSALLACQDYINCS